MAARDGASSEISVAPLGRAGLMEQKIAEGKRHNCNKRQFCLLSSGGQRIGWKPDQSET